MKHCGRRFPGPILAHKQLEIQFISRRNSKNSTGFEARFEFVHPDSLNTGISVTVSALYVERLITIQSDMSQHGQLHKIRLDN